MARYSGAYPTVDLMPARSLTVRVSAGSTSERAIVGEARHDRPAPVAPRASDAVWGSPAVADSISVLPAEFMEPIDPPTDLPGIEGFLEALAD